MQGILPVRRETAGRPSLSLDGVYCSPTIIQISPDHKNLHLTCTILTPQGFPGTAVTLSEAGLRVSPVAYSRLASSDSRSQLAQGKDRGSHSLPIVHGGGQKLASRTTGLLVTRDTRTPHAGRQVGQQWECGAERFSSGSWEGSPSRTVLISFSQCQLPPLGEAH